MSSCCGVAPDKCIDIADHNGAPLGRKVAAAHQTRPTVVCHIPHRAGLWLRPLHPWSIAFFFFFSQIRLPDLAIRAGKDSQRQSSDGQSFQAPRTAPQNGNIVAGVRLGASGSLIKLREECGGEAKSTLAMVAGVLVIFLTNSCK